MYKLLIVDDEYWVRKRLLTTIDWKSLGICEVWDAEDGKEALGICIQNEPDIIVTDINMPELTGIELMQALNESALYPRIILISGFNEFEYARSAIKMGVVDYLLKPIDENELKNIIKNIIEDFENQKQEKEMFKTLVDYSGEIRKRVLADLLTGKMEQPNSSISRLKNFLGIDFPYASATCMIAHSNSVLNADKNDYVEDTLISFSISNILGDILPLYVQHFFLLPVEDLNVVVLFSEKTGESLQKTIQDIVKCANSQLEKLFNINVAFAVGEEVSGILELNKSFKSAKYTINSFNFNDWNNILNYGKSGINENLDIQNVYFDYNLKTIAADIKNCDKSAACLDLKILLDEFLKQNNQSPTSLQIKLFHINVMNTLFKECLVSGPPSEEFLNFCMDSLDDIGAFFTPEKLMSGLENIVDFLMTQYSEFIGNKRHWLFDQITQYIKENFTSQLTMKGVASKFFLNPCYFCKIFKNETGMTFTHYLMRLRIEEAKKLLSSNKKMYDIAAAVGYDNVQYFSTIFKEIEGITPSQYRNSH